MKLFKTPLFVVFASLLTTFFPTSSLDAEPLDISWMHALSFALDNDFIFGKDIVFTFGPYNQLFSGYIGNNITPFLVGSFFLFLFLTCLFFLIKALLGLRVLLVTLVLLLVAKYSFDSFYWSITLLSLYLSLHLHLYPSKFYNAIHFISIPLLSLGVLIKLSYIPVFFCLNIFFVVTLLYAKYPSRATLLRLLLPIINIACILLFVSTLWVISGAPLSSLSNYFLGPNTDIILGYTAAMHDASSNADVGFLRLALRSFYYGTQYALFLFAYIFFINCSLPALSFSTLLKPYSAPHSVASLITALRRLNIPELSYLLFSFLFFFVSFKASFVRYDSGHAISGILFLLFSFLFTHAFSLDFEATSYPINSFDFEPRLLKSGVRCLFPLRFTRLDRLPGLLASILSSAYLVFLGWSPFYWISSSVSYLNHGVLRFLLPWSTSGSRQPGSSLTDFINSSVPTGAPLDVYPDDLSSAIRSRARYFPRPTLQSYSSYTPRLQQLDLSYLALKPRPSYISFAFQDIDRRFPLGLVAPSFKYILQNYRSFILSPDRSSIIFSTSVQKGPNWRKLPPFVMSTSGLNCLESMRSSSWIKSSDYWTTEKVPIPKSASESIYFLTAYFYDTPWRKFVSALFKPPAVHVDFLSRDGSTVGSWRIVSSAVSGIPISPLLINVSDFESLFDESSSNRSAQPDFLRFRVKSQLPVFMPVRYCINSGSFSP